MDQDKVRALLKNAIKEIQQKSGRTVETLGEEVRPFSDLEGFDSLNGEEVTILLHENLEFGDDFNPFDSDSEDELTIGQIVERIAAVATDKERARD